MADAELLTLDKAQALLGDLHDSFAGAHYQAWARWQRLKKLCQDNDAADLMLHLTTTTRANFLNNHCVSLVGDLVKPRDGVAVTQMNGLFTAVVAQKDNIAAFVRFKALNRDLRPSNVRTNVQKSLTRQEWPENLFDGLGIEVIPTVLTCGYRLSHDESEISRVYICCHYCSELIWYYVIDDAGEAEGGIEITSLPLPNLPTPKPRIVSTIIPEQDEAVGTDGEE